MPYVYSNPEREHDTYALPDVHIFEMTAEEVAEAMDVEEENVGGGWFYAYGFPGCMHDGEPIGPYATPTDAMDAMRDDQEG